MVGKKRERGKSRTLGTCHTHRKREKHSKLREGPGCGHTRENAALLFFFLTHQETIGGKAHAHYQPTIVFDTTQFASPPAVLFDPIDIDKGEIKRGNAKWSRGNGEEKKRKKKKSSWNGREMKEMVGVAHEIASRPTHCCPAPKYHQAVPGNLCSPCVCRCVSLRLMKELDRPAVGRAGGQGGHGANQASSCPFVS